jgi:TonB-linked SusC/RagA family outer membrane protein
MNKKTLMWICKLKHLHPDRFFSMMRISVFLLMTGVFCSYAGNSFPPNNDRLNNEGVSAAQQQTKKVTGVVYDEHGEPVIGANIIEKGTAANGTVSDINGAFSLNVQPGAVLSVSYIGYLNQEVKTGNQATVSIVLKEDAKALEEVVVVGYGTQKKANLTGAISTIKAEAIQNIPVSNLSNALAGRLAGVFVSQGDGGRPGNSSTISIRAKGSWNNTDPLYVIDGVVRDKFAFDGLDANDVESFSVLKDGASAAIYGVQAANGVVLVNTKKGKEGKAVITYSGSIGVSDATRIPETQTAYEQARFINDVLTAGGISPLDSRFYAADELDYFKTHTYNWMDVIWQNPTVMRHSLNATGGNERVRYFIGGTYYNETGIFNNTNFDRYNLRGNIEANITRNLIASLNLNIDMRNDRKPYWTNDQGSDSLYDLYGLALLYASSMYPPYINGMPVGNSMSGHVPEMTEKMGYYRKRYSNYEATFSLQYNVPQVPGLSLKVLYNNYSKHTFQKEFHRPIQLYEFKMTGSHNHIITEEPTGNMMSIDYGDALKEMYDTNRDYQLNGIINYDGRFGPHEISARFIYEQAEGFGDKFEASTKYFISNAIDQFFAGSREPTNFGVNGSASETGRMSYVGWAHYGYADKYMLEMSLRYDGSIIFAPERRWGLFPSVSGSWRVSEENFFKEHVKAISNLKLRAGVALLGNNSINGWQWMTRYVFDTNKTGALYGSKSQGISPSVVPNPEVTWEKSMSYNAGLDAGFLQNKLTLGLELFYKHTYDILGTRTNILPSTFGASMPSENYGVVDAHGGELELAYTNQIGKDFTYTVSGNIGYATNEVILQDEAENLPAYMSVIGRSTDKYEAQDNTKGRMRGYIATGLIRTQADLDALPEGYTINGAPPRLGELNYKDVRGVNSDEPDGKITTEDMEWIMDYTEPPITYGFSVGGSWKGIALTLFFQGVAGYDIIIDERQSDARPARKNFAFWDDHYTPENPDAEFPLKYVITTSEPASTFWLRNGAYLRLKNVDLSYTFPKKILSKSGVDALRIFFTGTNLLLLEDHVKYFDPGLGNEYRNLKRYPIMKSYSLGINLSF